MNSTEISQQPQRRPPSPCLNICTLDDNDVCTGCLRTLDEIASWGSLSGEAQWRIVAALPARAAARGVR